MNWPIKKALFCLAVFLFIVFATPNPQWAQFPCSLHWFGCEDFGRDMCWGFSPWPYYKDPGAEMLATPGNTFQMCGGDGCYKWEVWYATYCNYVPVSGSFNLCCSIW